MNRILVVDDNLKNIQVSINFLKQNSDYHLIYATSGELALKRVKEYDFDLILLDIMMPGMDGYEVCRRLKSDEATSRIPILFLSARQESENIIKGFEAGGADFITKPFNSSELTARVKTHLALKKATDALNNRNRVPEEKVREKTGELQSIFNAVVLILSALTGFRDNQTGNHFLRIRNYVEILAEELLKIEKFRILLDRERIRYLIEAAPLHDIGKVGISDIILHKPGRLNAGEFEIIKLHTQYGYDALAKAEAVTGPDAFLTCAKNLVYSHHERWDGSGYPEQIAGEEIPLEGRIMAVAGVYDALISKKEYKEALSHSETVKIIKKGRGTHFDPALIDAFSRISEQFNAIAMRYSDT